jgi:hypothetical protein
MVLKVVEGKDTKGVLKKCSSGFIRVIGLE